ncbi:enoyl-CoA hydratase-related protein [Thermoplasma sp.]|uniref:enoyl-CoA hydratase-related protein n=1 Tax=Thermoplasma sp. TaxID=1973142 RepID=UPI00126F0FFB|nr:enoyl-CoA hydratase-related protein [Thermoplasma sp.]KAA8922425.1 MAG: enoyl-CoA hydratase [Thermoplasma sp.]
MFYKNIRIEYEDMISTIVIDRPGRMNALDSETRSEMISAFGEIEKDNTIRAVIITGAGTVFSAGADLSDSKEEITEDLLRSDLEESFHVIAKAIRNSRKIFISAVNGIAAGAGISIALLCDLVFASKDARFILAFQGIGLAPDTGLSYILARLSGGRFSKYLITGGEFSAEYASQAGILELSDDPLSKAREVARSIADGPFLAYSTAKSFLNYSLFGDLEEFLKIEARDQSKLASSHDFKEGVRAFREKRKPKFRGN